MNRYRKDGKWWFRVRVHTIGDDDEISPWVPLESVEITDALACSRIELGPVYLMDDSYGAEQAGPELFVGIHPKGGQPITHWENMIDEHPGVYRIATPDELRAAGLWDD